MAEKFKKIIKDYGQFVIGICVIGTTLLVWRVADRQTTIAENTAKIAEQSAYIAQKSTEIQEKSMKIGNRAYFSVNKIEPLNIDDFSKTLITVKFLNSGQTPAYKVEHSMQVNCQLKPCLGFIKPLPESVLSEMIIGRNGLFSATYTNTISEDQIEGIKDKKLFITIIGIVDYVDVFKQKQWLKYQFFYNIEKKRYTYCKEHNDASF